MKNFVVLLIAVFLSGCGTLPSDYNVMKQFAADHPGASVDKVTSVIKGERSPALVHHEAEFVIHYHMTGDPAEKIAYRRFGSGAEGWVELTEPVKKEPKQTPER